MRCEAFEDRLQQLLDERQLPEEDAVLADHAAACPNCREVLDAQAGLFDTVRDWSVADLEIDLADRVVVRAVAASQPKRRLWWPANWRGGSARWISIVAAAALIVVAWQSYEYFNGSSVAQRHNDVAMAGRARAARVPNKRPLPGDATQPHPIQYDQIAREAAEDLGYSIAWGCHYLHRGRVAVTGVLVGRFPRKPDEPPIRSSSLLYLTAADAVA